MSQVVVHYLNVFTCFVHCLNQEGKHSQEPSKLNLGFGLGLGSGSRLEVRIGFELELDLELK